MYCIQVISIKYWKKNLSQSLLKYWFNASVAAWTDVHQEVSPAADNYDLHHLHRLHHHHHCYHQCHNEGSCVGTFFKFKLRWSGHGALKTIIDIINININVNIMIMIITWLSWQEFQWARPCWAHPSTECSFGDPSFALRQHFVITRIILFIPYNSYVLRQPLESIVTQFSPVNCHSILPLMCL